MERRSAIESKLLSRQFLRPVRMARALAVAAVVLGTWSAESHAKGGDLVSPFPITDVRAGKQEANAMAVDSTGDVVLAGYTNTGVNGNDWQVTKFKADGSGLAWAPATFGGTGDDVATAMVVDHADNIIVTGYTWNGSNYDVHTIKYNGTDGTEIWHHTYAGAGGINDFSSAVAVDASNNVYVAGYSVNGAQKDDILILKYASTGPVSNAPEWVELSDDAAYPNNDNRATAIAAGVGGIAITGYSSKAGTDFDILTRTYGFDKSLIRGWRYSSAGSRDDRGVAVRIDTGGKVIVTGYFTNPSNNTGIYTVKYDPASDTPLWEKTYDDVNGNDKPTALSVDSSDEVYVAGYTSTLLGNEDFAIFRYGSADGSGGWQVFYDAGNGSTDIPTGIIVDDGADGGIVVAGYTTAAGNDNFHTIKYGRENGTLLWEKEWSGGSNKADRPVGIGLDQNRNVCVAGWSDAADYDFAAVKYDFGVVNPPTDLTATPASDTSITLTWADNSSVEEKFIIQRKLGEGGAYADIVTTPATLPANTVTYTDTGLVANNYYYYRVRANNAVNGDSPYSNEARALTRVITYDAPGWSYSYDGVIGEDIATGVAVGTDDHPVITGYSLVADVGGNSYDYVTVKLNRADKSQIWKSTYDSGDGGTDMAAGVAIDTKDDRNDVIVTGTAYVFGGGGENSDDLFTLKYLAANGSASTDPGWPKRYGTGTWMDNAVSVVTAPDGSSAVIGYGMNGATGVGNNDIYVVKYNVDGSQAWNPFVYDSGREDIPTAVTFDPCGNILLAGYTRNAAGNDDWFVAKIDGSNGTLVWSDQMDGEGHGHDKPLSVAVDAAGEVYVTGYALNAAGNEDFVTIRYRGTPAASPTAERVWTKTYDGPANGNDRGIGVRIDPIDGAVVVAGTRYTTSTDADFFIARYNAADRSVIWERNFDRPATYDYVTDMAMDSSGYIYVAGNSRGGLDTNPDFNPSSDVLSIIYDFEGTFLSALSYDGTAGKQDEVNSVAVNYQGEAFVAGFTRNGAGVADYLALKHKNNYILVPAPLTATSQADYSKVDLTWRQNTPGTSFRIERTVAPSHAGSTWTTIATPGSGTLAYTDTGRSAGTGYCYRIDAYIGSLNSRKIEKCVTTTLAAPVLSPLTVDSTSQITLGWSQITGNTGYRIERKVGAGAWAVLTTKAADQNSHVDSGLAAGTTYYYRISTNSAPGYSVPSNEVSAITKPAAPTINAPTGITKSQMTVSWGAVTGASSYSLEYKESVGTYAPFAACTAFGGTSCTVTGLTTDKTYYFRVTSANASGSSDWSGETSGRALLPEPTLSSATGVSKTQVDLSWTAVAEATGYTIQQSNCTSNNTSPTVCTAGNDGYYGGWTQIGTTLAGTTTYSVTTGLSSGGNYRYRIISTVTGNTSAPSNALVAWMWLTPTPDANFAILPKTSTSLTVSWSDTTGETAYSIERRPPGGAWTEIKSNQALNTTSYDDTGLALSTEYCYRMRPLNPGVVGQPQSETYTIERCKFTPLNAPTLNAASNVTTTSATLTWNNITGNNGYEVQRSTHNDPQNPATNNWGAYAMLTSPKLGTDVTTHDDTALTPGYTYKYQVRDTFGAADYSSWSNEVQVTLIPPAPVLNNPVGSGTNAASLSWNNTYGETSFKVERKADAGGAWSQIGTSAQNTPSYSDSGLLAGVVYYYRVRGANSAGNSDYSNEKTVLPGPTLNALSGITASKIDLSWNNITGNNGYTIERKTGAGGGWGSVGTVGANIATFSNSGLAAGTLYYYRVSAINPSGGSLLSNEQSASTTPATPTATATVVSSAQVDLAWQVMYGATEYHVEQKVGAGGTWSPIGTVVKGYSQSYCGYGVPRIGCTSPIADSANYSATGLTENTTYCYQVKAWNSTGGDSTGSAERCVTTSAMASQSLTAIAINSFTIKLDWTPIACTPNPCDNPDGYEIEKQAWNNEWTLLKTVPGATATFTDTIGNEPLKTRKYRVRNFKAGDFSPYSNIAVVTTPSYAASPPTCP